MTTALRAALASPFALSPGRAPFFLRRGAWMNATCRTTNVSASRNPSGFTLLEVLVALSITLILLGMVMEMFARVTDGIQSSRAGMELGDQLRHAKNRLIQDLRGATAPTVPPLDPTMQLGYFEYVEGPRIANSQFASGSVGGDRGENLGGNWFTSRGSNNNHAVNSIIGDTDDILMFTTRSDSEPFVGRTGVKNGVPRGVKSRHAEVAWFLRRRTPDEVRNIRNDSRPEYYTLHRRQFLVLPNGGYWGALTYANVDHSLRPEGGNFDNQVVPTNLVTGKKALDPSTFRNTLGDLTKRECRSLHQPYLWPYQMMYIAPQFIYLNQNASYHSSFNPALLGTDLPSTYAYAYNVPTSMLSLPTLAEQSHGTFPLPQPEKLAGTGNYIPKFTFTPTPPPGFVGGTRYHQQGTRIGADVILTNVVGFDVKAWDPGAPVFSAPSTSQNPNNAGVVLPGDAGYVRAVDLFNSGPTTASRQPIGFGAFADLNYMGTDAAAPTNTARYRTYQDTGDPAKASALQRMEKGSPFNGRCAVPRAQFAYPGDGPLSGTPTHGFARPAIWDSWSTHYEFDGIDNNGNGVIDDFTNGVDDNNNGLVDEPNIYAQSGEQEAPPPYRSPLRGLKITLRVMEQDSKEVREVTIVHEFVPL
ncbi:MAG: hypothetical protein C0483_23850 [Pirellula sp.]|nr:hypothetical protein [Pirellula sp.]